MREKNRRYVYDPLYGKIYLDDFIWDIFSSKELQRLREVRLCNINSLLLPGAANISRFEHAIGTYHLARECLEAHPARVFKEGRKNFLRAALLHDFLSAPFGHSMEYIRESFKHEEDGYKAIKEPRSSRDTDPTENFQYKKVRLEDPYFGGEKLGSLLTDREIQKITKLIRGKGKLGPLINSDMDLDNIDNVFRLSYHIGLSKPGEKPESLARSLWVDNKDLVVKNDALPLVKEWQSTREKMYNYLLLNPAEFSAKCMLTEAMELAVFEEETYFPWYDTDFQLIERLLDSSLIKKEINSFRFKLDRSYINQLKKGIIPLELEKHFKKFVKNFNSDVFSVKDNNDGFLITDGRKEYPIKGRNNDLIVYKKYAKPFEIATIAKRLMGGELFGCIMILSFSGSLEDLNFMFDFLNKYEKKYDLSEEASQRVREVSSLPNARIVFHTIKDVAKTKRKVSIRTRDGGEITLGTSSQEILLGTFCENKKYNIYDLNKNISSETIYKIRDEIKSLLREIIRDKNLSLNMEEVELYAEGGTEKSKGKESK